MYLNFVKMNSLTLFSNVEFEMTDDGFPEKKMHPLYTSNKNVLNWVYLYICAYTYILYITGIIRKKRCYQFVGMIGVMVPGWGWREKRRGKVMQFYFN